MKFCFSNGGKNCCKKTQKSYCTLFTSSEVLEFFNTQLTSTKNHWFLSMAQHKHYKNSKDNLGENDAVVHVNFSESYDNKQQHVIQSADFG